MERNETEKYWNLKTLNVVTETMSKRRTSVRFEIQIFYFFPGASEIWALQYKPFVFLNVSLAWNLNRTTHFHKFTKR